MHPGTSWISQSTSATWILPNLFSILADWTFWSGGAGHVRRLSKEAGVVNGKVGCPTAVQDSLSHHRLSWQLTSSGGMRTTRVTVLVWSHCGRVGYGHPTVHSLSRHRRRVHRSPRARQEPASAHRARRVPGGDRRAEAGQDLAGADRVTRTDVPPRARDRWWRRPFSPDRRGARLDHRPG